MSDLEPSTENMMLELAGEPYVDGDTMAKHLNVVPSTLKNWIKKGAIENHCYIKVGTTYRYRPDATIDSLQQASERQRIEKENAEKAGQMTEQLSFQFD